MKICELIDKLRDIEVKYGNVDVWREGDACFADIESVTLESGHETESGLVVVLA